VQRALQQQATRLGAAAAAGMSAPERRQLMALLLRLQANLDRLAH